MGLLAAIQFAFSSCSLHTVNFTWYPSLLDPCCTVWLAVDLSKCAAGQTITGESISRYIFSSWSDYSVFPVQQNYDYLTIFSKIAPSAYYFYVSYCLRPGSLSR